MSKARIAVIGGGIVGVSCGEYLRRDGGDVTIIDRLPPGDMGMTSFGNAGLLATASIIPVNVPGILKKAIPLLLKGDEPLFMRYSYLPKLLPWLIPFLKNANKKSLHHISKNLHSLLYDCLDQHEALAKGTPAEKYIKRSNYLYLYHNRRDFEHEKPYWDIRHSHGFKGEELSANELHEYDKNLHEKYSFGYLLGDHGFITNPAAYVKGLHEYFIDQGGKFIKGDVKKIITKDNKINITASDYSGHFDKVVIATGAHTDFFTKMTGVASKIEPERGYHIIFKGASIQPNHPYMGNKYVITPMEMGVRLAGLVEFSGPNSPLMTAPTALLLKAIKDIYPTIQYNDYSVWTGARPSTPDSLPLIGADRENPNIFYAAGHQHIGLTAAAKTGKWISALVNGHKINGDLSAFHVNRFG